MDTAFVIGNGESRAIFPIDKLKGKGTIWGCNAIYRDYPYLCDKVVAVNKPMYDEINDKKGDMEFELIGPNQISEWNYLMPNDTENDIPKGLKIYRIWRGGDLKKNNQIRTIDFSQNRGSGTSAVLLAAESNVKNILILGFDILGAKQSEYAAEGGQSREQNNMYKSTQNYPTRLNMKAYLKYEWMYQLRQIFRRHSDKNFYYINRREYIDYNNFLPHYLNLPNVKVGIYADLRRWIEGDRDKINWIKL